jgi:hypothetical protein
MWYAYEQVNYFPMLAQQEYLDQFDGHISYRHDSYEQISYVLPQTTLTLESAHIMH